ncbi:MAG: hypothetical protein GC179_00870 [Anaerolineaceae bacterium]|nr:hypothetical protein [Anaerolineaceae bacterium]
MIRESKWMDRLSFLFTFSIITSVGIYLYQHGIFVRGSAVASNTSWYLIRAAGTIAYILLTTSVLWGLALTTRVIKDWSPGALSMVLHSTLSWLAVAFSILHALLLLTDNYLHYDLSSILIPFTGPYRPLAVGLGTLACWLALIVAGSFALKKHLGHRLWKILHLTSYGLYAMITLHALLAGSDADKTGFRVVAGIMVLLVVVLFGYRLGKTELLPSAKSPRQQT